MSKILDKNFSTFDCHLIMKSGKRVIHRWFHVAPSSNILLYSEQRLFEWISSFGVYWMKNCFENWENVGLIWVQFQVNLLVSSEETQERFSWKWIIWFDGKCIVPLQLLSGWVIYFDERKLGQKNENFLGIFLVFSSKKPGRDKIWSNVAPWDSLMVYSKHNLFEWISFFGICQTETAWPSGIDSERRENVWT